MKKLCFFAAVLFLFCFVVSAFAKVDLNTASVQELTALPGIGKAKAEAIVKYREANGPFKNVNDLTKVKGIGPKMLSKLKNEITLGDSLPSMPSAVAPQIPGGLKAPAAAPAN